ncbi:MAG TPA: thioredoxin family protein [Verrucomicrobiae bacterium]|jgi:thioredoxin-related protein|nr:thioredoxin family protein [Verrucomicrobiae bacterium]
MNIRHPGLNVVRGVIFLFLLMGGASIASDTAGWGADLTNAFQNARSNQHAVLLEFSAPWCPYCRQMESKTFKDQHVADALKQFERVSVNIDHNASLAAQHGVTGIPAFVLLDSEGDEMAKTSGFMDASAFSQWLTDGMTNLTASAAQRQEFETRSNEVVAALSSADLDARAKGLGMVLDCCERREKIYRTFGLDRLQVIAKSEPTLLLEGLNYPALMARIRVANLLRETVGQNFNIDPWETERVRRQGVEEWKGRLANLKSRLQPPNSR